MLSKRRLIQLVTSGLVNGWDDPRMPTISGLRRRGVPPAAIKLFIDRTGVSKADNNIDYTVLEDCVRESLDPQVPRAMAVLDPLKVTITNWPEGEVDQLEVPIHPKRPEMGTRMLPFDGTLYIERDDYSEEPPPKYFRLRPPTDEAPTPQVRLHCMGHTQCITSCVACDIRCGASSGLRARAAGAASLRLCDLAARGRAWRRRAHG